MSSSSRLGQNPFITSNAPKPSHGASYSQRTSHLSSSSTGSTVKKRTSHACDRCRLMRTKCSGGARCSRCTKDDAQCVYGDHKRERNKKDLAESVNRISELELENDELLSALRQVTEMSDFRPAEHDNVMRLLTKKTAVSSSGMSVASRSQSRSLRSSDKSPTTTTDNRQEKPGEGKVSSGIGSPGKQGELRKVIDLDSGAGAAGFIGKMSEMSWMQRCREYLAYQHVDTPTNVYRPEYDQHTAATLDLTYFMDDANLLSIDEDHLDAHQWPAFEVAVVTTEAYFQATEGFFEILHHENFVNMMYHFPRQNALPSWKERRWLALANLVWAIGSRWLHYAKLNTTARSEDHLIYFARARALGLDHRISFDHPDPDMVQGMGLLAFYLLMNGSITRAWNTVGNALRHAMSLGLHLKVSDPSINEFDQVQRAKIWFSLYKIQMLIAEVTGRPPLVRTAHATIPIETLEHTLQVIQPGAGPAIDPEPIVQARQAWADFIASRSNSLSADEMSDGDMAFPRLNNPQGHFLYCVRLCQLSEDIADSLYTGQQDIPWQEFAWKLEDLQEALEAWIFTLPDHLKLGSSWPVRLNSPSNIQLAMYGYSVAMILNRPCLCNIEIEDESVKSKEFNIQSARNCVKAAISMLEIMPEEFMVQRVYSILPWWSLLHYLCQAASVLLLELCLDNQHFEGENADVASSMWKAMNYLAGMAEESMSAYKAWRIFDDLLQRISMRYGDPTQFHPLVHQPVRPRYWGAKEETALLETLRW